MTRVTSLPRHVQFPNACQVSINLRVFDLFFAVCVICKNQRLTRSLPRKKRNQKKNQRLTLKKAPSSGLEVIETVEEAPIVQTAKEFHFPSEKMKRDNEYQFISDKTEPQVIVNENAQPAFEQGLLPSYEDMMCEDVFNGPSSMETQPDLAPVKVLEEGVAVTQDGRTVEWWPPNLDEVALQEYLIDVSKPFHTNFVLPEQGLADCYTCPVFFGNANSKHAVLDAICNSIHPKIHQQWGTFACHCGLVPRLKLSLTSKKPKQSVPKLS